MPIYEFHCERCGGRFKRLIRAAEGDAGGECPCCRSSRTHTRLSPIESQGEVAGSAALRERSLHVRPPGRKCNY